MRWVRMIANFVSRRASSQGDRESEIHDPVVAEAVSESRKVLARNRELVKELAAVERAIRRRAWVSSTR